MDPCSILIVVRIIILNCIFRHRIYNIHVTCVSLNIVVKYMSFLFILYRNISKIFSKNIFFSQKALLEFFMVINEFNAFLSDFNFIL